MSILTKKQRLKIYRKAYELYQENWKMIDSCHPVVGDVACLGLCSVIHTAARKLRLPIEYCELNKQTFPEWFSYKPKTGWKTHPLFWWTISAKNGGYAKRMDVLHRLSQGKSKGE